MTYQEAYKILEINQSTNSEEIKKAYKRQAKKYHPDIYHGDKKFAEEKMKQINEAYAVLSTPHSSTRQNSSYQSTHSNAEAQERAKKMYEDAERVQKEFEEYWRKTREDLERIQKEIEEQNRKMRKIFKRLLTFLFCTLEFYIIVLFANAIRSIIFYFNEQIWFLFGYFILLGFFALAGVILAPIGFRWLMKKAKLFK